MKENYFIYKGNKYNSGTMIIIRYACNISRTIINTQATFIEHDLKNQRYVVEIYGKQYFYSEEQFYSVLCTIVDNNKNKVYEELKECNFRDELSIDGLLIAWIWYIFIMLVGVIFYDRMGIWILASLIFFKYRNKKLKEAGYK